MMKIAIAQLNPTVGDINRNARLILEAAEKANKAGATLMVTPEMSLIGYPPRDLLIYPSFIQAAVERLEKLAQELPPQLSVLVGTVTVNPQAGESGGKALFNTAALLAEGEIKQFFHKRLLPTYDVFDEDRYFEEAKNSNYFLLGNSAEPVTVGVTICEDIWNDEQFWGKKSYAVNPLADLADLNVDFVANLSASPYHVGKQKLREEMLVHSVRRYQKPIVYANQVGGNDDLIFEGSSVVFARTGEVVARANAFKSDLLIAEFSSESKNFIAAETKKKLYVPKSEEEEIWLALVLGVRDYLRKCGFSKVVLGLSGGIDSALVAAIAAAAVGKENVLAVLMPSPYSSEGSVNDALELAENLGIQTQIIPIADMMKSYDRSLNYLFAGTKFGIAEENIQSRIRGNLLMAISNKFGHLLLSTGNKSEMAVGYCTLYGDMNGGLAVISDVPKTRVYSICRWLNARGNGDSEPQEIIPTNIINKAPSAELKPGQKDGDSLPSYDVLDDVLYRLIEKCESLEEIREAGHDGEIVNKVVKLVMRAEFKRRQAPPGLKISDRAFGTGWRMPIAKKWLNN